MSTAIITEAKVPHYIDGQWVESNAREWSEIVNPATGESLGKVPISDAAEVTKAIDAAAAAYPGWGVPVPFSDTNVTRSNGTSDYNGFTAELHHASVSAAEGELVGGRRQPWPGR